MVAYKVMFSQLHRISGEPCHSDLMAASVPCARARVEGSAMCRTGPHAECSHGDEPISQLEGSGLGSHPQVASESPGRPTEAQISRFGPRVSDSASHGLLNTAFPTAPPGDPSMGLGPPLRTSVLKCH